MGSPVVFTKVVDISVTSTVVVAPPDQTVVVTVDASNKNQQSHTTTVSPPTTHSSSSSHPASSSSSSSSSSSLSTFQQEILSEHNKYRSAVGSSNLSWDSSTLQKQSDSYAPKLCSLGLKHSGVSGMGENLYWVSSSGVDKKTLADDSTTAWYDEKSEYSSSNENSFHYSQLVWKGTTHLACSYADCGSSGTYVVCNYSPQGNIIGEFDKNVPT
ncbi:hypothetical protein DASC09_056090 [Saccharomycopsis crataegensis]|uniref:SCP domain-containing protein n=1 Tax=Saccharomycopsis crataegensis TaxID=43959 RepID=A0AAV5QVR0_9ASCO|nr:hypothetical protein DASC09_056090 [Saccharomycopsis crataegensis]